MKAYIASLTVIIVLGFEAVGAVSAEDQTPDKRPGSEVNLGPGIDSGSVSNLGNESKKITGSPELKTSGESSLGTSKDLGSGAGSGSSGGANSGSAISSGHRSSSTSEGAVGAKPNK